MNSVTIRSCYAMLRIGNSSVDCPPWQNLISTSYTTILNALFVLLCGVKCWARCQ